LTAGRGAATVYKTKRCKGLIPGKISHGSPWLEIPDGGGAADFEAALGPLAATCTRGPGSLGGNRPRVGEDFPDYHAEHDGRQEISHAAPPGSHVPVCAPNYRRDRFAARARRCGGSSV